MKHTLKFEGKEITFDAPEEKSKLISEIISDLLTKPGFINIDAEDVKAITDKAQSLSVSDGTSDGEDKAEKAAQDAVKNVKNIAAAKGILFCVKTGVDVLLVEMMDAAKVISEVCDPDCEVIWGHVIDDSLGEKVNVRIIAAF